MTSPHEEKCLLKELSRSCSGSQGSNPETETMMLLQEMISSTHTQEEEEEEDIFITDANLQELKKIYRNNRLRADLKAAASEENSMFGP